MKDFIPENILVYIAVDNSHVVKGMEKINAKAISMLKEIYTSCRPDNPAKGLYEKLGFTNKYLEMRLIK
jgi:ribosomal protein S18 acetylase RimI-like enzyme